MPGGQIGYELKLRVVPHCADLGRLDANMRLSRTADFQEYFNSHRSMHSSRMPLAKTNLGLFPEMPAQQPIFQIQPGEVHGAHPVPGAGLPAQDPQKMQSQQMMQIM